jgi:predicted NUDIX family NTP pyrophosphohydrolase
MQESAGALLYTMSNDDIAVLLVHPSGNYNRHAPWSIPKGLRELDEDLLTAARRETLEETGIEPGELVDLGSIVYSKSRKRVHCFAGPMPDGAVPRCASWEIDQAEIIPWDQAIALIHPDQLPFLERLSEVLRR